MLGGDKMKLDVKYKAGTWMINIMGIIVILMT